MAYSLNRAQIIGNVVRDPEVRSAGGQPVATFSVATNFSWTDSSGQRKDKAEYHNIVVWRKLAEIAQQYVKKGGKIYVEGKMQTREWQGEDGVKRYKTEIVADNIILLDRKGSEGGTGSTGYSRDMEAKAAYSGPRSNFTAAGIERPQRAVKGGPVSDEDAGDVPVEMGAAPEVSIDDLPF